MPKPSRRKPPRDNRLNASYAATGDAVTVPVRWVKFFVGLFLLPICYVLTAAFFSALIDAFTSQVADRPHFWMTPQFWFFGLGFGARQLAGLFAKPVTWRILDGVIALTMIALSVSLALT